MTLFRLGKAYFQLGNYKGAEMLLQGCVELREGTLDDYTPCADAHGWLGVTKTALGDYENAANHLNISYRVFVELYGAEHEMTYRAINRLVDLYRSWGRPDQAASISEAFCQSNDPIDPSRLMPPDPIRAENP
ncbi:MAG: tetratricopeptide repeat protein [Planctomycetes bacterium]|nr:tetratricopeptide repeat protein [Planctomycetota bacterium]